MSSERRSGDAEPKCRLGIITGSNLTVHGASGASGAHEALCKPSQQVSERRISTREKQQLGSHLRPPASPYKSQPAMQNGSMVWPCVRLCERQPKRVAALKLDPDAVPTLFPNRFPCLVGMNNTMPLSEDAAAKRSLAHDTSVTSQPNGMAQTLSELRNLRVPTGSPPLPPATLNGRLVPTAPHSANAAAPHESGSLHPRSSSSFQDIVCHDAMMLSGLPPIRTASTSKPPAHSCPQVMVTAVHPPCTATAPQPTLSHCPEGLPLPTLPCPSTNTTDLMQKVAQAERAVLARRLSSLRSAAQMPDMLMSPTAGIATHFSSVTWGNSTLTTGLTNTSTVAAGQDIRGITGPQPSTAMSTVRPTRTSNNPPSDALTHLIRSMSVKVLPLNQSDAPPTAHAHTHLPPPATPHNHLDMNASLDESHAEHDTDKRVAAAYAILAHTKAGDYNMTATGADDDAFAQDQAMHPSPFACSHGPERSDSDGALLPDTSGPLPAPDATDGNVSGRNSNASMPDWQMGSMSLLELHAHMDVDGEMPEEPFTPTAATAAAAMAGAAQLLQVYEQQVLAKAAATESHTS